MQNNNEVRMASANQIAMLQRMGYTGDVSRLTMGEASTLIGQLQQSRNAQPQPQNNNAGYTQPTYQAPVQQPKPQYVPQVANVDCNITTRNGESFALDKQTVEMYICNGTKLTDSEYRYFFSVCKNLGLNPFLRDIYAIKFGNTAAQFVIDYKVLQQAADENPYYNGMKTGVLVANANGVVSEHEGAYLLPGESLLGAYCEVYRKDRTFPVKSYAMFSEVCKYKDGNPSGTWKEKPVFMNVKVAKAWALREAFPNLFSNNTYTSDELNYDDVKPKNAREAYTNVINHQESEMASVKVDDNGVIEEDDDNLFNRSI